MICGTTADESTVAANGWVNVESWTGISIRNLPRAIREPAEPITHCNSIVAALRDSACDPRSGGLAGTIHLAHIYGVSARQFRRNILPDLQYVKDLCGIPVTNVMSAEAHAAIYRQKVKESWCQNLELRPK